MAAHKYKKLGKEYNQNDLREPTAEEIGIAEDIFRLNGLEVIVGG